MEKKSFIKLLAVLFLLAILFTPQHSKTWIYFFIPGISLGITWFVMLK